MISVAGRLFQGFSVFLRALGLLTGHRTRFVLLITLSVLVGLTEGLGVSLLVPVLESVGGNEMFRHAPILGSISDFFAGMETSPRLRAAALVMLIVVLIRGGLLYYSQVIAATLPYAVRRDLSIQAYDALMRASLGFVAGERAGTIQNQMRDLPARVGSILINVGAIVINLFVIATYVVLLLALSWEMTMAAIGFMLVTSKLIKVVLHGPMRRHGERATTLGALVFQHIYETLIGLRLIRLTVSEGLMKARYDALAADEIGAYMRQMQLREAIAPVFATASGVLICTLILAASLSADASSSAGQIILFMFLLFRIMGPVSTINSASAAIQGNIFAMDELERFRAALAAATQKDGGIPYRGFAKEIAFEGVSFRYPSSDRPVFDGLTLTITKGEMVALVGPSGAGKSTVIGLLARFYDPVAGRVAVDGTDLRDFKLDHWRRAMSVVSQENVLFNDTVLNNIRFGLPDATEEQVRGAARSACATEFIDALPNGYSTLVGERGTRLSGGQQQRLALARAILSDPELLVLDEATSQLDSITEHAIQDAIERLRVGRTIVVIAHRLATIRRADRILVMDQGRVVEEGSHDELLAHRGKYWEMLQHQSFGPVE